MNQRLATVLMVCLVFCFSSIALAKPGAKKSPKKKTASGTIEKVDARRHTIAVKPSSGQQIQTQSQAQKKGGKPPSDGALVFYVGKKTKIVTRGVQQDDSKDATAAQRHESKAPLGGVLMSSAVYERVQDRVEAEPMTGIQLKGIETPQTAYVLKGFKS